MTNTLEYKGYQGTAEISFADNVIHGKILHILDLVTYEANSIENLKKEFEEAVDDYLETCKEEGVSPDKPYSGTFNVRLTPELHRNLAIAASRQGKSLNNTIKQLVTVWLECPEGLTVAHHHTHEHTVLTKDDTSATYSGAVHLIRKKVSHEPRMTLQ